MQGKPDLVNWERWKNSNVLAYIKERNEEFSGKIVSNHPSVIYVNTGLLVGYSPVKKSLEAGNARNILSAEKEITFAWFDVDDRDWLASPTVLRSYFHLEELVELKDGVIFRVSVGRDE